MDVVTLVFYQTVRRVKFFLCISDQLRMGLIVLAAQQQSSGFCRCG